MPPIFQHPQVIIALLVLFFALVEGAPKKVAVEPVSPSANLKSCICCWQATTINGGDQGILQPLGPCSNNTFQFNFSTSTVGWCTGGNLNLWWVDVNGNWMFQFASAVNSGTNQILTSPPGAYSSEGRTRTTFATST